MPTNETFNLSIEKLKPEMLKEKYHKTYKTVVIVFSYKLIKGLTENHMIKKLEDITFTSSSGSYDVFEYVEDSEVIIFNSLITAPATVAFLEEVVYAFSIKNIILQGSAGVLDKDITAGKIIIPTKAYRDEGTSYHYEKSSDFIDVKNYKVVENHLIELNIEHVKGYAWTTDAFYRETEYLINKRKKQGCIAVEMEISAVQAFCNFRNLNFYAFIFGADNLDSTNWDSRILGKTHIDQKIKYFLIATTLAKKIQ